MNARSFNGDDDRDDVFASDPIERCPVCRVDEDEPCEPSCDCQICLNAAEVMAARRAENGETLSERQAFDRDVQAVLQRTVK